MSTFDTKQLLSTLLGAVEQVERLQQRGMIREDGSQETATLKVLLGQAIEWAEQAAPADVDPVAVELDKIAHRLVLIEAKLPPV